MTAIVSRVVAEHLDDSRFDGLTRIGVDEINWASGLPLLSGSCGQRLRTAHALAQTKVHGRAGLTRCL